MRTEVQTRVVNGIARARPVAGGWPAEFAAGPVWREDAPDFSEDDGRLHPDDPPEPRPGGRGRHKRLPPADCPEELLPGDPEEPEELNEPDPPGGAFRPGF
jgi:hypothetical protein